MAISSSPHQFLACVEKYIESNLEKDGAEEPDDLTQRVLSLFEKIREASNRETACRRVGGLLHFNTQISSSLSLSDFKTTLECGDEMSQALITLLSLERNIKTIDETFLCIEQIKQVSHDALKHVSLLEFQLTSRPRKLETTSTWYALAPEEMIASIQVGDLSEVDMKIINIVCYRIKDIEKNEPEWLKHLQNAPYEEYKKRSKVKRFSKPNLQFSIAKLRALSSDKLHILIKHLPENVLSLLSDHQLANLDYKNMPKKHLSSLFLSEHLSDEEKRNRVQQIPEAQLSDVVREEFSIFNYLSNEQCYQLDPDLLSSISN